MANSLKILFYKATVFKLIMLFVQNSFAQKPNVKKQSRKAGKQLSYMLSGIDPARSAGTPVELVLPYQKKIII